MKKHLVKWMSVVGLAAAVMTLGVSLASAQEQPPAPDRPLRARAGDALDPLRHLAGHVIAATGLTPEAVQAQVAEGMTLAEIAEAAGADVDAIIEWEVSEQAARLNGAVATGRLTRAEADARLAELRTRIVAGMDGELPLEPRRPLEVLGLDIVNVVADVTGLTPQQIIVQAREGATLTELIEANGGDMAAVEAEVVAQATEKIDAAVAAGTLTPAQADAMRARLPEVVSAALTRDWSEEPARPLANLGRDLVGLIAEATDMTAREIVAQARAESLSLGEVIAANGGDVEALAAQVAEMAMEHINTAAAEGALTQAQADRLLAVLPDAIDRALAFHPGAPSMGAGE